MKSFAFTEDIILFGNRKKSLWTSKAAGLTVVLEEWVAEKKGIQRDKWQIMEMRLHLNSAHLSKALSVSHRSPECFSSRPTPHL